LRKATTASGGSVTEMLFGRLWRGMGLLETTPPLPVFVPPKSSS
jgi:hypothetical protein